MVYRDSIGFDSGVSGDLLVFFLFIVLSIIRPFGNSFLFCAVRREEGGSRLKAMFLQHHMERDGEGTDTFSLAN